MAEHHTIDEKIVDDVRALLAGSGEASSPGWHHSQRQKALDRFERLGLPHKREDWKYTRVASLLPKGASASPWNGDLDEDLLPVIEGLVVRMDNGRLLSVPDTLPSGLTVCSLSDALHRFPEIVTRHLDQLSSRDDPFAAMNMAVSDDGLFVHVAAGASVSPALHVLNAFGADSPSILHARQLIVVEKEASFTLVEHDVYMGLERSFTNATVEVSVAPSAHFSHYRLQRKPGADHVDSTAVKLGTESTYRSFVISTGDRIVRNTLEVLVDGPGCHSHLFGLFFADGSAQIDNHTLIDHAAPDCTSRELYKGILSGKAMGTFRGMLLVQQAAQRTSAFQSNRNLLLSESASVNALPQLEIYADDVKCSHGATTGLLEPDALFYLRARGIPEAKARRMLVEAFMAEITDEFEDSIAQGIVANVLTEFLGRQGETS